MKKDYRLGVIGCGFWANYQVAAWGEIPEVEVVAVCDRDLKKMRTLASKFNISQGYTDVSKMLDSETLDFVDVISSPETHPEIVMMAAKKKVPVICQKPMAIELATAKRMVQTCHSLNVPFYIHENFRWQMPMIKIKEILDAAEIGKPFKARIYFNTHYPVIKNQPSLALMEEMIIADLGVHLLDLVRFFFGEVKSVFCRTQQVASNIKGEDVANVFLETHNGVHCTVELSWSSRVEKDCFPQTLITIDGVDGSINLGEGPRLTVINPDGTREINVVIPLYHWMHPDYAIVHSALVPCNIDLLGAITGRADSNNRADLNLETLKLVRAAYDSAKSGNAINMKDFDGL